VALAPAKKKESEDNSKRLAVLFYKLNADDVSAAVCGKLLQVSEKKSPYTSPNSDTRAWRTVSGGPGCRSGWNRQTRCNAPYRGGSGVVIVMGVGYSGASEFRMPGSRMRVRKAMGFLRIIALGTRQSCG
jgi:hypothetical protein